MQSSPVTASLTLTPEEHKLQLLLKDVAQYVDQSGEHREPVVLRWAGGWVRDKLLGIKSHDIDTAVNLMTGEAFCSKIVEFCERSDVAQKHRLSATDIGNLHKIPAKPDKSKHLEPATIKLLGFDVDFVNLRTETYTNDSRNPLMEFGTAEEDAMRRDATVNALFYNLNTGKVEDFTGGLADMQSKLIRTPLEPLQTFMDDPLRVLRLIRFASRLEFIIDPHAEEVMGDPGVLDALRIKISRERVGVEVEKMLKGNHPKQALEKIDRLGLYHTVFTDPNRTDGPQPDITTFRTAYHCLDHLQRNRTPGSIYDVLVRSDEAAYFAWVLAAVAPWANVDQPVHVGRGKPPPPLATLAAREGIKAPNKLCEVITAAEKHRSDIMSLKRSVCNNDSFIRERDRFGMPIRQWESRGGHWKLQVLSALLVEALEVLEIESLAEADNQFLSEWQLFLDHIQELDVMEAPSLKRIIDGTQLAKTLGVKPGKWMAQALDICVAWQLRNPGATDPSPAVEEVRRQKHELGIPI